MTQPKPRHRPNGKARPNKKTRARRRALAELVHQRNVAANAEGKV